MIKNLIDSDTRDKVLNALKQYHDGKEVLWIDLDGVVADFKPKAQEISDKMGINYQEFLDKKVYRSIDGFYRDLSLITGAKESILELVASNKFYISFLSAPSWCNISSFSDKRIWIENEFGKEFEKKMDLSFHKGHYLGHYLIDDRIKYGTDEFIGEHIHFGQFPYYDWNSVLKMLIG